MPNRSERRAAERAALKAQKSQTQAAAPPTSENATQPVAAEQTCAAAAPAIESTASQARINANRENAKSSTGPTTTDGKERVSFNRRTHGLIGRFALQATEDYREYEQLVNDIYEEFNPQSATEARLANSVIQHYWLMQRALRLQELNFHDEKKLALYLRYQTTHERSYYKAQKELQNLQKQTRKDEIGFEQQKQKAAESEAKSRLANARAEAVEIETEVHKTVECPLPGNVRINFSDIQDACAAAVRSLAEETMQKSAAAAHQEP